MTTHRPHSRGSTGSVRRRLRLALSLLVLAAVTVVAGCGRSASTPSAAESPTATTTPATSSPVPSDGLSGLGATRATWAATHQPVAAGSAGFGPVIRTASGHRTPTFTVLRYAGHDQVVASFTESFPVHTAQVPALTLVARQLPADAQITQQQLGASCELVEYRSHSLATRSGLGRTVVVRLVSPGSTYEPQRVDHATISRRPLATGC